LWVVIGLWVRAAMTSTPPVMVPPGRTGVRKAQLTFEQHRSSPGSFGDNGIEDGAGNTALNDHLAEAGRLWGRRARVARITRRRTYRRPRRQPRPDDTAQQPRPEQRAGVPNTCSAHTPNL